MIKNKYNIVAVDFDGTLCENAFPEIGQANTLVIDYIKKLAEEGAKIILFTCREDGKRKLLTEAVNFCKEYEIPIYAVNENPDSPYPAIYGTSPGRKVHADIYIDDKALNPKDLCWADVYGEKTGGNNMKNERKIPISNRGAEILGKKTLKETMDTYDQNGMGVIFGDGKITHQIISKRK